MHESRSLLFPSAAHFPDFSESVKLMIVELYIYIEVDPLMNIAILLHVYYIIGRV